MSHSVNHTLPRAWWTRLASKFGTLLLLLAVACGDSDDFLPPAEEVASVVVAPAQRTLVVGEAATLTATARDAAGHVLDGRAITWASSDAAVVTVTSDGRVTAVGAGAATVTATSEGKTGRGELTVTRVPVGSVQVLPGQLALELGQASTVRATTRDAAGHLLEGRAIAWRSSDPTVAAVAADGRVTALAVGAATIIATSEGVSGTASVAVAAPAPPPVDRIDLTPTTVVLEVGATRQVTAVLRDAAGNVLTGRVITWTTDAPGVISVGPTGLVRALGPGYATVVATSEGKSRGIAATVGTPQVVRVDVTPESGALAVGEVLQLTATPRSEGGVVLDRPVTWKSDDDATASVGATGRVTGRRAGLARITATSEGVSRTIEVWVYTVTAYQLTRVGDAPLPRTLFTTLSVGTDGVVRTRRWDAHEGHFRLLGSGGFEQTIMFWIHQEGGPPTQTALVVRGSYQYDVTTPGGMIFYPYGSGAFRGRVLPDGTFAVKQQLMPDTPELTLVHTRP